MNIKRLQTILTTLDAVGISTVTFEPEDGGCRVRGTDKALQVVVFHHLEEDLVEKPMGIQSVKGLLSRLNLFDIDKASVDVQYNDTMATSLQIKLGRKKAGFTFVRPSSVPVPRVVPQSESNTSVIELSESYVDHLTSVIAAMSYTGDKGERYISIAIGDDCSCTLSVFDGEDDSYVDQLADLTEGEAIRGSWDVPSFNLVMKNSMKLSEDKTARFTLSDLGIAAFQLGEMVALVSPLSSS